MANFPVPGGAFITWRLGPHAGRSRSPTSEEVGSLDRAPGLRKADAIEARNQGAHTSDQIAEATDQRAHTRKVCLFIPHLAIGGAELQLSLLARELGSAGFEPVVATLESRGDVAGSLERAGIPVHVLPRKGASGIDAIAGLARLARTEGADLLHAWLWVSNWRAALARLLAPRLPVVLSIRSMEDDIGRRHEIVYRLVSPLVDAIIVNGRAVLERSAARTGIPRSKYRVVPNAVEWERLEKERADPGGPSPRLRDLGEAPLAGYVGSLHPRKRVRTLPRIASRILDRVPGAGFLVVGDGPEREAMIAECRRLGVSDRFHFEGYQSRVGPYLGRLSVLVHPSMNEGCCNAILEAEALGVPVVAYAVGGNTEIVQEGRTGFLVPDGDEDALAERTAWLLAHPVEARAMGENGRRLVREQFSVPAMTRRTVAVYEEVLTGRSS